MDQLRQHESFREFGRLPGGHRLPKPNGYLKRTMAVCILRLADAEPRRRPRVQRNNAH
jgi:hypothetical protein